ncbi:hypothetical protein EGW08_001672, partial [Elysia chlorotica]
MLWGTCSVESECSPGWSVNVASGTCVKVFSQPRIQWEHAKKMCEDEGGYLVKIIDSQMNNYILGLIGDKFPLQDTFWLGFKYYFDMDTILWAHDETKVRYIANDHGGVLLGGRKTGCAQIKYVNHSSSSWIVEDCQHYARVICERGEGHCPVGWVPSKYSDTCLLFNDNRLHDWQRAREACQVIGADLLTIQSQAMQDFIMDQMSLASPARRMRYWIGLNALNPEGIYTWLDQPPENDFTSWANTSIDSLSSARCIW